MPKVMEPGREKVLDKLRKLHSKYQSAQECSTEAEAQAFAAMIQKLLSQHKIDMSEIEYKKLDETDPIRQKIVDWSSIGFEIKKRRIQWHETLASFVCEFNFCRFIVDSMGTSRLWFVGRTSDVEPCVLTYLYLIQMADKIAEKEYVTYFYECKRNGNVQQARGFRSAFLQGFCTRLRERYTEEQERIRKANESNCTALVRLTNAVTEVKNWMDKSGNYGRAKGTPLSRGGYNEEGTRRGRAAAEKIPVGRQENLIK